VIANKLLWTYLIELERGKCIIIVQSVEKISYKRMVTRLHLRANHINSRPFSVYIYGHANRQTLLTRDNKSICVL